MNSKYFIFFIVVLSVSAIMISGCAPRIAEIHFDQTNQKFIESTIGELDLASAVTNRIPAGSKICFVSMEEETTEDFPLLAMIEDNLVSQLLLAGYSVLERDDDLLRRLIQENSGNGYQYSIFPGKISISEAGASVINSQYGHYGGGAVGSSVGSTVIEGAGRDSLVTIETNLFSAEYLVSYRLLECGMVYRSADNVKMKKREGQVRLHIRVIDANSGKVIVANNIESRLEDLVAKTSVPYLENYHYSFFRNDYPLQGGTPARYREIAGKGEKGARPDNNPR